MNVLKNKTITISIMIIRFDNIQSSMLSDPSLTPVVQNFYSIGQTVTKLLIFQLTRENKLE